MNVFQRTKQFVQSALLGGLVVLLPLAVIGFLFRWLYGVTTEIAQPLIQYAVVHWGWHKTFAELVGILALLLICFLVGNLVMTRLGRWFWQNIETRIIARLPGYRAVREIVTQLLGSNEESPFRRGEVARVWIYGRGADVSVLGLVTARFPDGHMTVFVPTGPNPTTGFIYIVEPSVVTLCPDIKVEQMMKVVVACGAGSHRLFPHETATPTPSAETGAIQEEK